MVGKNLSPILAEIEQTLWEHEATFATKPNYTIEGFRGGIKIFMSVLLDKMWELQVNENMDNATREDMAVKLGNEVRKMVKTYTNIDTHDLY